MAPLSVPETPVWDPDGIVKETPVMGITTGDEFS